MTADQADENGPRRLQHVILREIAGEVFLVPIRGRLADLQELFVLNDVGEWIWKRLDGTQSAEALAQGMASTCEVTEDEARAHLRSFVNELEEAGLLEHAGDEESM